MASYALRREEAERASAELAWYAAPDGECAPRAYCGCFFVVLAAALGALRLLDCAVSQVEGEPLLQPWWTATTQRCPWLFGHAGFGAMVAFAAYLVSCAYFTSLDLRRSMATKLQKHHFPSIREMIVAGLPQIAIYTAANYAWYSYAYQPIELPRRAPTLPTMAEQLLVAFVAGDFFIYWEHRLMHHFAFTRKHIHSWHHAYTAPFSWAGGVIHPLEGVLVMLCQTVTPLVMGHHPLSFWTFVALWTVLLIEEHSGHAVCWAPYNWMPFTRSPMGGGAAPHDIHHYKVTKNFAFVLCVWDHAFDTFEPVVDPPNHSYLHEEMYVKTAIDAGSVSSTARKSAKMS